MFSPLRNRFGIPGVISIIALVFAMAGGAFAANSLNSGGSKATASASGKRGPRGPRGPRGKQGPAGPAGLAGPQGPAGAKGDTGATGAKGADGAVGPEGKTGATGATGATGPAGAGGPAGPTGPAGQSGFTETLPTGKTEKGAWSGKTGSDLFGGDAISFPIPLTAPILAANVHIVAKNATGGTECASGTAADPKAAAGHLCVYIGAAEGPATINSIKDPSAGNTAGAGISGAIVTTSGDEPNEVIWGTWAVTAP